MYAGDVIPAGWLLCNGSAVSRTAYAALYAAIGTAYGAGDGSSTFAIPDFRDRAPVGVSGTKARGSVGGSASATLTVDHIPQHSHTIAHSHTMNHGHGASAGSTNTDHLHYYDTGYSGGHSHLYEANVNRQQYQSGGSFGATYAGYTAGTGGDGGHSHSGYTGGADRAAGQVHSHSVTVNDFNGSTGGSSAASSGNWGTAAPTAVPTVSPYAAINFIIKT
jgi:microcystin-dependent protein